MSPYRAPILLIAAVVISACAASRGAFDGGDGQQDAWAPSQADSGPPPNPGNCPQGDLCDNGAGLCAGGSCCPKAQACDTVCCPGAQVCSFGACATPGAPCIDSSDCAPNEYCDNDVPSGSDAGAGDGGACLAKALPGRCVARPPYCGGDGGAPATDAGTTTCLNHCEAVPQTSAIAPQLAYSWGGVVTAPYQTDVMMTPLVIQLDDDDCDGQITARDIPEIVFTTFSNGDYGSPYPTHAISIVNGKVVEKWASVSKFMPMNQLAGGNIDGKPGNEIVGCTANGVAALNGFDGSLLWETESISCNMPAIADLNQDGAPEVIVEGGILDGKTGVLKHTFFPLMSSHFLVSDLDGDGYLDIVTANQAFDRNGVLFASTGMATGGWGCCGAGWYAPFPAIGDFNLDGKPEVVTVDDVTHTMSVWRYDATVAQGHFALVRAPVDINATLSVSQCGWDQMGYKYGGGAPTVADFNGDGTPDIGLAGGVGYVVFDGKKVVNPTIAGPNTVMWITPTQDCSSATTSSSVFDFNGDGRAEVVYGDEQHLHIYDGATGAVLWETCNTNGTLSENPVVADVDGDGHADIVAVSNAYTGWTCNNATQAGVSVFSSSTTPWVRTRGVWNEHTYHVTNVEDDGTIPAQEAANWTTPGLNNFRCNKQPGGEFYAPDAIVSVGAFCQGGYHIDAVVRNIGEAALPPVEVSFYVQETSGPMLLGKAMTSHTIQPLQSDTVTLVVSSPPPDVVAGTAAIYAVVDDQGAPHPTWAECRIDNNRSPNASSACPGPN